YHLHRSNPHSLGRSGCTQKVTKAPPNGVVIQRFSRKLGGTVSRADLNLMQQPEWISGNVFIRPHRLAAGERIAGHKHNFDHTSIVFTGAVQVTATLPNGSVVKRMFTAPAHFLVKANVEHE